MVSNCFSRCGQLDGAGVAAGRGGWLAQSLRHRVLASEAASSDRTRRHVAPAECSDCSARARIQQLRGAGTLLSLLDGGIIRIGQQRAAPGLSGTALLAEAPENLAPMSSDIAVLVEPEGTLEQRQRRLRHAAAKFKPRHAVEDGRIVRFPLERGADQALGPRKVPAMVSQDETERIGDLAILRTLT